jgi:hypothetical protein
MLLIFHVIENLIKILFSHSTILPKQKSSNFNFIKKAPPLWMEYAVKGPYFALEIQPVPSCY